MTTGEFGKIGAATAGLLTIGLPLSLWAVVLRPWRAKSRLTYALRLALWPPVILSFDLGVPLTLHLFGVHATYGKSLGETAVFVGKCSLILGAALFVVGWYRGKGMQRVEAPAGPEAPR